MIEPPSGTTINNIDKNIDTGKIISQIKLTFDDSETLSSTYKKLREASIYLFRLTYPLIRNGYDLKNTIINPPHLGTTHFKKDSDKMINTLPN